MYNQYTSIQREIIDTLALTEQWDKEACDECGGEDCLCCEIYVDRQMWVDADQLFAEGGY